MFEKLLADIVGGTHLRGARLPPERELVRDLGASRASVRDALRRLEEWRLISIRHGSGAVVRPRTEWTFEALPASLRVAKTLEGSGASDLIRDALELRRVTVTGMVQLAAARIAPGALATARATVAEAWRVRANLEQFAALDLQVMHDVLDAAEMLPAMWLLNKVAPVYVESIRAIGVKATVPSNYVEAHRRVFDALEKGDGRRATSLMQQYMEEADRKRLTALRRSHDD